jgi:hydroxypyruvate isomerase
VNGVGMWTETMEASVLLVAVSPETVIQASLEAVGFVGQVVQTKIEIVLNSYHFQQMKLFPHVHSC